MKNCRSFEDFVNSANVEKELRLFKIPLTGDQLDELAVVLKDNKALEGLGLRDNSIR